MTVLCGLRALESRPHHLRGAVKEGPGWVALPILTSLSNPPHR
jgi:hypothetical protein